MKEKRKTYKLNVKKIRVRIRFLDRLLGSVPSDKETYIIMVASKADPEGPSVVDELETLPKAEEEKPRKTYFHKDEQGRPLMYNYVIKGFLKTAFKALQLNGVFKKIPAYRHKLDLLVFVEPRRIVLADKIDGDYSRGLRANTMMGPRVTFITSEYIEAGHEIEFEIHLLKNKEITADMLRTCFEEYGPYHGLGQWRSGGWGTFEVLEWREM